MFREQLSRERASMRRQNQDGEHFWVASYPFFDTALIITPPVLVSSDVQSDRWSQVDVYDCDGAQVNSVAVTFDPDSVATLQLDPLMGSCKLESGFKVAHIAAKSQLPGVKHRCRVVSHEHACLMGAGFSVLPIMPAFFPISFAPGKQNFITAVNYGPNEAAVRVRLFFGTRTPEILCTVPGMGARIISLETEFQDCAERATERSLQAYIRVTTKSDVGFGVQLLERTEGPKETNLFYSLA